MKEEEIKKALIRKLLYMGKWGNAHTSFDNLPKGFPKHLRGDVKNIAKELLKEQILLSKPTHYGLEVSLNPEKRKNIEKLID